MVGVLRALFSWREKGRLYMGLGCRRAATYLGRSDTFGRFHGKSTLIQRAVCHDGHGADHRDALSGAHFAV